MKYLFTICIALIVIQFSYNEARSKESYKTVDYRKILSWGEGYRFVLKIPKNWNEGGDYTVIGFKIPGEKDFVLKNFQGEKISAASTITDEYKQKVKPIGKYAFEVPANKEKNESLVVFSNNAGAEGSELVVFGKLDKKYVYLAWRKILTLSGMQDYDNDGLVDILTKGGRGEPTGENNFAYNPYLVYKQVRFGNKVDFSLDEELSKKWALENKQEWYGSKYDEKIRVNNDGILLNNQSNTKDSK